MEEGSCYGRLEGPLLKPREFLSLDGYSQYISPQSEEIWMDQAHTSPFASSNSSVILPPSSVLDMTSDATQPSVASGCHAFVPTS
jgi:hypothetical protein